MTGKSSKTEKPRYIVVEGIDGTGKSTLIAGLKAALEAKGVACVALAEPTGGKWGKDIRRNLGDKARELTGEEWLQLFEADRRENMELYVKPALKSGKWVLQDRSFYSTAAYQGAQGLDVAEILKRSRAFALEPDLVLILDLDPKESVARIRTKRGMETDAFERADYLEKVRAIFKSLRGGNIVHLDASAPAGELVAAAIEQVTSLQSAGTTDKHR